jgi:serine/threonine protein kinase
MRWAVRITVGGTHGYAYTAPGSVVAGRDPGCAIALTDVRASRKHCRLTVDPPRLSVRDLGSRHGTLVNGVPVGERELADGDELRLGDTTLRVACTPADFPGYRISHEIGRGAQGAVFLAYEEPAGRPVALKVVQDVVPGVQELFLREMRAMRALRHPNIVEFRAGGAAPALFLASGFCSGGSVDRLGRLPAADAVPLILGVLDGLAYAHRAELPEDRPARGLVHRDIKPQNVLVADGVARIADFGLAKAFELAGLSGLTRTGDLGGTVGFMPRAQVLDYRRAEPAVDVWAAAATLYWLLTGATPREFPAGADPVAVVLREDPVPVRDRDATVPAGIAATLDEALTEGRAMTAGELREALERAR